MSEDDGPQVTTTHAGYGEGRPRLQVAATGVDGAPNPDGGTEFEFTAERTVIGSDPRADIRVDGVDGVHAEIEHTDREQSYEIEEPSDGLDLDPGHSQKPTDPES